MINRFRVSHRRFQPAATGSGVPVLSSGSHRDADDGACFMEYASFLAGERWSDHPSCTHPLLAHLAREVNDRTSDPGRAALAPLIPSVIGLTGDDPVVHPRLVTRVVQTVLPSVAHQHQVVLAVALLRAEQLLDELEGRPAGTHSPATVEALADAALATTWAKAFLDTRPRPRLVTYLRRSAPRAVSATAHAAAEACHADPDLLLRRLLEVGIDEVTAVVTPLPERPDGIDRPHPAPEPVRPIGTHRRAATT